MRQALLINPPSSFHGAGRKSFIAIALFTALAMACAALPADAAGWIVGAGSTLVVSGTVGGDLTVESGGVLTGTGSVNGDVTIADNGILSPGSPVGTLSVNNLALNNSSVLDFGLGSAGDLIQVNGDLTLDGVVNVMALTGFGAGSFPLIDYTGSLTNETLNVGALPAGHTAAVDTASSGTVNLIVDPAGPGQLKPAVPVPAMNEWGMVIFMLLAGIASVAYLRRRRVKA
jgi:hypothetical protein